MQMQLYKNQFFLLPITKIPVVQTIRLNSKQKIKMTLNFLYEIRDEVFSSIWFIQA